MKQWFAISSLNDELRLEFKGAFLINNKLYYHGHEEDVVNAILVYCDTNNISLDKWHTLFNIIESDEAGSWYFRMKNSKAFNKLVERVIKSNDVSNIEWLINNYPKVFSKPKPLRCAIEKDRLEIFKMIAPLYKGDWYMLACHSINKNKREFYEYIIQNYKINMIKLKKRLHRDKKDDWLNINEKQTSSRP